MSAPSASSASRMERYGTLPADGFAWRFVLVLAVHVAALYLLLTRMQQPVSIVLGGEPGGGGGGAVVDSVPLEDVNWVDSSMVDLAIRLPQPPTIAADEPESDLPLPQAKEPPMPAPEPEPVPEPPKEVVLKPIPKPEPPKEVVLKPVPKPEPPKEVVLKPVPKPKPVPAPPKPKPVVLKPAPAPAPKPKVVAANTPVLSPAPSSSPKSSAAPVRAVPVAAPVGATPIPGMGVGTSASGSGGSGSGGFGSGPGGNGGPMSDISAFHLSVKDAYISQWQQPHGLVESGSKYRVRVEIVIGRTGNVVSARVVARSGNAEMDRSVQEAVSRVSQVDPLPAGIGGATYAILLNFDI